MRSLVAGILSLTLPQSAGPGQPRIVIGPFLPPPLNTFTWAPPAGGVSRYVAGLIFYGQGDDTTYVYVCLARNSTAPTGSGVVHVGQVRSGAVLVDGDAQPQVQEWNYDITAGALKHLFNPSLWTAQTGNAVSRYNSVSVSQSGVLLRSDRAGTSDTTLTGLRDLILNYGGQITAGAAAWSFAGTPIISDVNVFGGDYQLDSAKTYTVTDDQYAQASALLNVPLAITAVPGTLLNITSRRANARLKVFSVWDFQQLLASPSTSTGFIYVDGVQQSPQAIFSGQTAGARMTIARNLAITLAAAGAHTVELRAQNLTSATAHRTNAQHTDVMALVLE